VNACEFEWKSKIEIKSITNTECDSDVDNMMHFGIIITIAITNKM